MKLEDDLKKAISNLPNKEKEKLLFRLLRRDTLLIKKLDFELVSTDTAQMRRAVMETTIEKMINATTKNGILLTDLRTISSMITEHIKVTGDKYGEVSLNILMINELLNKKIKHLANEYYYFDACKLLSYLITRIFKILVIIKSLHEDYATDFEDGLKTLGEHINNTHNMKKACIKKGLDIKWLLNAEIPDYIKDKQKEEKSKQLY